MTQAYSSGLGVIAVPTEPASALDPTYSVEDRARWAVSTLQSRTRMYYYGVTFKQPDPSLASPEKWDQLDSKAALEALMDKHGPWRTGSNYSGNNSSSTPPIFAGLVDALLQRTPDNRLQLLGLNFRQPLDSWHRGRCVLVGDAVHAPLPTSGQVRGIG
jgi:2-polyprenyl-6-methoxyphenol hydroxylase-like FAD-dependent oxidoreductase